ncbi:unnamed protein product [Lampetra planeri]
MRSEPGSAEPAPSLKEAMAKNPALRLYTLDSRRGQGSHSFIAVHWRVVRVGHLVVAHGRPPPSVARTSRTRPVADSLPGFSDRSKAALFLGLQTESARVVRSDGQMEKASRILPLAPSPGSELEPGSSSSRAVLGSVLGSDSCHVGLLHAPLPSPAAPTVTQLSWDGDVTAALSPLTRKHGGAALVTGAVSTLFPSRLPAPGFATGSRARASRGAADAGSALPGSRDRGTPGRGYVASSSRGERCSRRGEARREPRPRSGSPRSRIAETKRGDTGASWGAHGTQTIG